MTIGTEYAGRPVYVRGGALLRGTLLSRPNRFLAVARVEEGQGSAAAGAAAGAGAVAGAAAEAGRVVMAHVADPGRMELLVPGASVYLSRACAGRADAARKTEYDLVLVEYGDVLVSVDSRVPNELVHLALRSGFFEELEAYTQVVREAVYGDSRFDFRLTTADGVSGNPANAPDCFPDCFVEVKSCTLVQDGVALFPDSPTVRGTRHIRGLERAVLQGFRAMVIFVIQREDASCFAPNSEIDPKFADALRNALSAGVSASAIRCHIEPSGSITLGQRVPVSIG